MEQFRLILILFCMAGSAFFSGMETGVISIHRMRLKHFIRCGDYRALVLQDFLNNPDRLFGVTLVGNNLTVVTLSILATGFFVDLLGRGGETVATVVMTLLVLLFCEYIPKAWFHTRPYERCSLFVTPLLSAEKIFQPLARIVLGATRLLVPGPQPSFTKAGPLVTREDLKAVVREGERNGVLSADERAMIHRVFELSRKRARDIMIPRERMQCVRADMPVADYLEQVRAARFTRMPVLKGEPAEFVGVINVYYALSQGSRDQLAARRVEEFMRRPLFIPDTMPVDDIFPRLRRAGQPMCFVKDDTGAVAGLITTEDILEEIVGKL